VGTVSGVQAPLKPYLLLFFYIYIISSLKMENISDNQQIQ